MPSLPLARRGTTLSSQLGLSDRIFASGKDKRFAQRIDDGLEQVELGLREQVRYADEIADVTARYLLNAGGKRVRPMLTLLTAVATQCKAIVTVEEHSVNGGLGEACASHLMQKRLFLPMKIMGIPDEYTVTGSQAEILAHYEISRDGIAKEALNLLR